MRNIRRSVALALAAIMMMAMNMVSFAADTAPAETEAVESVKKRKRTSETESGPVSPNCDPAQRSQFGKEEGASGYGAFAASAEAECSWLLLTPRRTLS